MKRTARKTELASFLLLALFACNSGGGGGCTSCTGAAAVPYPDPPPAGGAVQPNVLRARMTQNLLDFLRSHLDVLLQQFLTVKGNRAYFYIDSSLLPANSPIVLRNGSSISFNMQDLENAMSLSWVAGTNPGDPPRVHFSLHNIGFYLNAVVGIDAPTVFPSAACHLEDAQGLPAVTIGDLSFDIAVSVNSSGALPTLDGSVPPDSIQFNLGNTTDNSFLSLQTLPCDGTYTSSTTPAATANYTAMCGSPDALCPAPQCTDGTACTTVGSTCSSDGSTCASGCQSVCKLVDLFTQLGGFLQTLINPVVQALAPSIANVISGAMITALQSIPLGIQTQFDAAGLFGPVFAGAQPLNIKVGASSDLAIKGSNAGRGLDVGLDGGATTTTPALCAAGATPPDLSTLVGPPPDYTGFVEVPDATGTGTHFERYHLAVGISQALLTQAVWSMFQSGLLCINLDAYQLEKLAGSSFSFTAGLLMNFDARLAGITDPSAPMLASIQPTSPPTIRLGAGGPVTDSVNDPLIEVGLNNMHVGIYMQLDDTLQQITELNADVVVRLAINRAPDQSLNVVVQDFAVSDLHQLYNELAPSSDLSGLFKIVVDLALNTFLGNNLHFNVNLTDAISAALGIPLQMHVNAIRRDYGSTGAAYLSLYTTLCDDSDIADPSNPACYIAPPAPPPPGRSTDTLHVALRDTSSLYVPAHWPRFDPARWIAAPSGHAVLQVTSPFADAVYQYRVDGGFWSTFRPATDGTLTVDNPLLLAVGHHHVDVRSERRDEPSTRTDAAGVSFWVDRERPQLTANRQGDNVQVSVSDLGSPHDVQIETRLHHGSQVGPWQPADTTIPVRGLTGILEIVGRDAAGNTSQPIEVNLNNTVAAAVPALPPSDKAAGGCAATPVSGWAGLWVLLVPLGLLRRRRH